MLWIISASPALERLQIVSMSPFDHSQPLAVVLHHACPSFISPHQASNAPQSRRDKIASTRLCYDLVNHFGPRSGIFCVVGSCLGWNVLFGSTIAQVSTWPVKVDMLLQREVSNLVASRMHCLQRNRVPVRPIEIDYFAAVWILDSGFWILAANALAFLSITSDRVE